MPAQTQMRCPACQEIVDDDEILTHEIPEDFEELLVEDPPELPDKYRGHVQCFARTVHIQRDCKRCHEKHVN